MNRSILSVCSATVLSCLGIVESQESKRSTISEYPSQTVREEQLVVVNGSTENLALQWKEAPKPHCGANESDLALTCHCMGFAYGELGDLDLIRLRNGAEIDRLHLTPLFKEEEAAVIQRWPTDDQRDFKLSEREDFSNL